MAKEDTSSARDLMVQGFRNDMGKITHYLEVLLPFKGGPQKFIEMANLAILRDMKLLECDRKSLLLALIWCAQKNLEPGVDDGAWLVPFKGIVVPIPAYKGLIKKAVETGSVNDVQPYPVFASDTFEYGLGMTPYIDHKPPKLGAPRGDLIGVYVVITMPDGTKRFWVMDREDVEKIRASSAAFKSSPEEGPWHDWFVAMAMKTVIKQGFKYIPVKAPLRDLLYDDGKLEAGETVATLLRQSGEELGDLGVEEPGGAGEPGPEPDTSAFDKLVAEKLQSCQTAEEYKTRHKLVETFIKDRAKAMSNKQKTVIPATVKVNAAKFFEPYAGTDGKEMPGFWKAFEEKYPLVKPEAEKPPAETAEQPPHEDKVITPEVVEEGPGGGEGAPPEDEWGTPVQGSRTFEQEQGDIWNIVIKGAIPLKDLLENCQVKSMADITPENINAVKAFVTSWEPAGKKKK